MKYKVYIEDELIDLTPNTIIAGTFQAASIGTGDLVSRRASYTNQISVPKTNNNIEKLGYSNFLKNYSSFPYLKKRCRVLSNGIQIIDGVSIIKSVSDKFDIQIYSLAKDVSLNIGNGVLSDLDFGDSPITWNAAFWDSRRSSTTGWCCPVIEYGQITKTVANGSIGDYYLPSIAYKDIVTAIFQNAGYTVSGDFYDNDEFFNNMVLTYSRDDWPVSGDITMNQILSDKITKQDFLRDMLIKFCAFLRVVNNDIEIVLLEDILNDFSNAVDWTAKRISRIEDVIEFKWDGWSQNNIFKYPDRGDLAIEVPILASEKEKLIFNGSLDCLNEDIDLERTVYQSPFFGNGLSSDGYMGVVSYNVASVSKNIFCATLRVWETEPGDYTPFDNEPEPMLCLLRDRSVSDGETSIQYNGNNRTDYKVAYFCRTAYEDIATNVLRWEGVNGEIGLLERFYATLRLILSKGVKKVTRYYNLNDVDIYSLDPLKLVFDDGEYFLIDKVVDYVQSRLTKVELLKATYTRERLLVHTGLGELTFTGYAPNILSSGAYVFPGTGELTFTGYAPTVFVEAPLEVTFIVTDAVTGNPIYRFVVDSGCDTSDRNLTSPETDGPNIISACGGGSVDAYVEKISDGGLALDTVFITYRLNGVDESGMPLQVNTGNAVDFAATNYTYSSVSPGDTIEVEVTEG